MAKHNKLIGFFVRVTCVLSMAFVPQILMRAQTGSVTRTVRFTGRDVTSESVPQETQRPAVGSAVYMFGFQPGRLGETAISLLHDNGQGLVTKDRYGNGYVLTDANGDFDVTGLFSAYCPTTTSPVYFLALGGNTGYGTNVALALASIMPVSCSQLSNVSSLEINEETTVAAAYTLGSFSFSTTDDMVTADGLTEPTVIGMFGYANELVNGLTGTVNNTAPEGGVVPVAEINSLADVIGTCVNSNDGTACQLLFSSATPIGGTAPGDTLIALTNIARYPNNRVNEIYELIVSASPYSPILNNSPANWAINITYLPGPKRRHNAAYLSHAYVTTKSYISSYLSADASYLQYDYATDRLFVNCGTLSASGVLMGGASGIAEATTFLNAVANWETENPGFHFTVFAYLNGSLDPSNTNFIDVSNSIVRANIASQALLLTSSTASGSYIQGSLRQFDGVLIDVEPSGGTNSAAITQFNELMSTMDGIASLIGSTKVTGFVAPQYSATSSSTSFWSPNFYYSMASHVNYIVVNTYNSKTTTAAAYQTWIESQATNVLQAVSGEYWTDGSHSTPTNGIQVLFGFPAFPNDPPNHYADAEDIENAAIGVNMGLSALDARAYAIFSSAAIYLTTDGTGNDGYASWNGDWQQLSSSW